MLELLIDLLSYALIIDVYESSHVILEITDELVSNSENVKHFPHKCPPARISCSLTGISGIVVQFAQFDTLFSIVLCLSSIVAAIYVVLVGFRLDIGVGAML